MLSMVYVYSLHTIPRSGEYLMSVDEQIGARFRELREALGFSLREVSDQMTSEHGKGWSFPYLSALEKGNRRWSYENIEKLAKYYKIPPPLVTDATIPLENIQLIGKILTELANAPEDRLDAFLRMLQAL